MNKSRRKALTDIAEKIDSIKGRIEELREEEQDYLDNMPENLQDSENAYKADSAISSMDEAIYSLEEVMGSLEEAAA